MNTIKSTININKYYKEQLEYLVRIKELDSVTEGINLAIAEFVKSRQKALYAEQMREAAQDKNFMERTMTAQKESEGMDANADNLSEDCEW